MSSLLLMEYPYPNEITAISIRIEGRKSFLIPKKRARMIRKAPMTLVFRKLELILNKGAMNRIATAVVVDLASIKPLYRQR